MKKNRRKAIVKRAYKVNIYVWVDEDELNIVFTDRNGDEFFKMIYHLTDGRSLEDNIIKETVRFVINTHISKGAEINITFWKYNGHKISAPTESQLDFQEKITSFIKDNKLGPPIKLKVN